MLGLLALHSHNLFEAATLTAPENVAKRKARAGGNRNLRSLTRIPSSSTYPYDLFKREYSQYTSDYRNLKEAISKLTFCSR